MLTSCDPHVTDHLPTSSELEKHYPHFISKPVHLESVYRNSDTNAFLFLYTTADSHVLDTIAEHAQKNQWEIIRKTNTEVDFFRSVPPPSDKTGLFGDRGLIRIGVQPESQRVCVAWFSHSNKEFAEKHLWPKYKACMQGAGVVDTLLTKAEKT